MVAMVSGVCSSEADEGTSGLPQSKVAMFSQSSLRSFSSSESLRPGRGVRSSLTILN